MVKELFVENFADKRPLIPSAGVLLHKIARDHFHNHEHLGSLGLKLTGNVFLITNQTH
jgi:hypothetical protein